MKVDSNSTPEQLLALGPNAGVSVDQSKWYCDAYVGEAQTLLDAGIVTAGQLLPQEGRRSGRAIFLPDASPAPSRASGAGWRIAGHKVVLSLGENRFRVEITVERDEQARRLAALKATREREEDEEARAHEAEVALLPLLHEWHDNSEMWEGTKAQLQAEGIGVGVAFPGEPEAPKDDLLTVVHPEGFKVTVQPHWDSIKARAGRYVARGAYVERDYDKAHVVAHAPGVDRLVYRWSECYDTFVGTADALVACGLARTDQFPGQPGRGSVQCSYCSDGSPASNAANGGTALVIKRRGKNRFLVEMLVAAEEKERRRREHDVQKAREKEENAIAKRARMSARDLALLKGMRAYAGQRIREEVLRRHIGNGPFTIDAFRKAKLELVESIIDDLWASVFCAAEGPLAFKIAEDDDENDDLGEAFELIRDAVNSATVCRDRKMEAALEHQRRAVAAKADAPLQRMLTAITTSAKNQSRKVQTRDQRE